MTTLVPSFLDWSSSFLQVTRQTIKAWMSLNFRKIPSLTSELATIERLKNQLLFVVTTLVPSFSIGSSSFLQIMRTTIKSRMGSKFGLIEPWTVESAALERLEYPHTLIMGEML